LTHSQLLHVWDSTAGTTFWIDPKEQTVSHSFAIVQPRFTGVYRILAEPETQRPLSL
jgi:hypothetical protein